MDKKKEEHRFWNNEPMMKPRENVKENNGYIEDPEKILKSVSNDKLTLLEQFEWSDIDITNEKELEELYVHLRDNFGEDKEALFRFHYSKEFLSWSLGGSRRRKELHIGVRVVTNKKLIAFIAGTPTNLNIYDQNNVPLVEINYLCIHKKLRNKRLAPILIQEVTRRVYHMKMFTAIYTFGQERMRHVSRCTYWHRFLNIEKCLDTKFLVQDKLTRDQCIRLYRLEVPNDDKTKLVEINRENIKMAYNLYLRYVSQLDISVSFTLDDFIEHILPRKGIVYSYMTEDCTTFFSFFCISSTVLTKCEYSEIRNAYLYYHSGISKIANSVLQIAKELGFDVLSCLDIMDNGIFLKENKFCSSEIFLNYYLYNWRCKEVQKEKLGVILH